MSGVDIGGDWYDVVPLDDGRFVFVVGDVSGRGGHLVTGVQQGLGQVRADEPGGASDEILHDSSPSSTGCGVAAAVSRLPQIAAARACRRPRQTRLREAASRS